ncbi:MAG: hypothetical protein IJS56_04505 [Bacilli bacterium]|nr:hypothetical protein [Bacilli bacterium]
MKKTYEFKNDKYNIEVYMLSDVENENYKTSIIYGDEDYKKWILSINGEEIALTSTGCNIPNNKNIIIEKDTLDIITEYEYFKIDLKSLKCLVNIDLGYYMTGLTCNLIKYKNGFLVICDFELICIDNDKVKWVFDPYNGSGIENIEILENDIIKLDVLDAYGLYMYTAYLDKDGKQTKKH